MKNYIHPGDFLTVTATRDVLPGEIFAMEDLVGVAVTKAFKGESFTLSTEGVFELPKAETDAIKTGARVRAEKGLITLSEKGLFIGLATEDAGAGTKSVKVKLCN